MPRRKKHTPEEIVAKLRQVEVLTGQGTPVADAIRAIGVTEAPPAPEIIVPDLAAWPAAQPRPASPATLRLVSRPALN